MAACHPSTSHGLNIARHAAPIQCFLEPSSFLSLSLTCRRLRESSQERAWRFWLSYHGSRAGGRDVPDAVDTEEHGLTDTQWFLALVVRHNREFYHHFVIASLAQRHRQEDTMTRRTLPQPLGCASLVREVLRPNYGGLRRSSAVVFRIANTPPTL